MTPLRRVLADKRRLIVPVAIALLANLGLYVFAVRPLSRRQASVQDRAAAAAQARRAAEEALAAAHALVDGKSRADEELATFYDKVLPPSLSDARRMTYASLPTLARKTNVTFSERRTELTQTDTTGRPLGHLQIRMQLAGDYDSIRQFIYELENAPEFLILDDVELAQNDPARPLSLIVALSAYYRLGDNGI
ncbi:MAG: hypothetical protein IT176_08645 [Acidobacteria bacterium]|nr:hypothetical protein [Acidobacteriota bacterium]